MRSWPPMGGRFGAWGSKFPAMRFLTLEWWLGDLPKDEDAARADWNAHFESIRDRLPVQLLELFDSYWLHDGRLHALNTNAATRTAEMVVDASNTFGGNYPVLYALRFSGVASLELNGGRLNKRSVSPGLGDLGYYEVDVLPDGRFRMDFLFWSGFELGIVFDGIETEELRGEAASVPPPQRDDP